MPEEQAGSYWDAIRSWADSLGLLNPRDAQDGGDAEDPPRPKVPQAVCDNCPICQAAALLDQVDPQVVAELTEVARGLVAGLGSALASAAEQRMPSGHDVWGPDRRSTEDVPAAREPDVDASADAGPSSEPPPAGD